MVPKEKEDRVLIKTMTPELFKFHGKKAYEYYDVEKTYKLQDDLHKKVKQHLQ